jgi:hypothetical protein
MMGANSTYDARQAADRTWIIQQVPQAKAAKSAKKS